MVGIPFVGHLGPLLILVVVAGVTVFLLRQYVLPIVRRLRAPDHRRLS
jgi:hypothetical protein